MKEKIFMIIIKHSPTSIQRSPTQKVCSAPQNSKPFVKRLFKTAYPRPVQAIFCHFNFCFAMC